MLAINAGSSSIRLDLIDPDAPAARRTFHQSQPAQGSEEQTLRQFLDGQAPRAVAHRIVHGGARFATPTPVTDAVVAELEQLSSLAPLHLPRALRWLRAARVVLPEAPQVAVFDTAFFAELPEVAATYAIPRSLAQRLGLRRYGFHGLAHAAMWRRWSALRSDLPHGGRVISLQLGAGCSAAAILEGRPIDTSMGFSPTEGLVMATRSGDVDPGLLTYLMRTEGLTADALDRLLTESSGLLGISGVTGDMQRLCALDDHDAKLAVEVFCQRVKKYVGAYVAVLGGVDAILFGGGIGEHSAEVRARCLGGLESLGVILDAAANEHAHEGEAALSPPDARVAVWVMQVDEAAELARQAWQLIRDRGE